SADDGALRAAELCLERGRQALPASSRARARADRAPLSGGRAHLPAVASTRAARRAVERDVPAARAGFTNRRSAHPRRRDRPAARAGTVSRAAPRSRRPTVLQARGAAAVRETGEAARAPAAARRAEPRPAQID